MTKDKISELTAIKNLLVILALKEGIQPEAIGVATGVNAKSIRNTFPMRYIKEKGRANE